MKRFNILIITMVFYAAPTFAAGYLSIGGAGKHGYGQISVGHGARSIAHGGYGISHGSGRSYYLSGAYYSPPIASHSYSNYCYGVYCGGVQYIRAVPSIDYFRGMSDAASGINCIGCIPSRVISIPSTIATPVYLGSPTVIIQGGISSRRSAHNKELSDDKH
jgi:hypothetical protein